MLQLLTKAAGLFLLAISIFPLIASLFIANQQYLHLLDFSIIVHDPDFNGTPVSLAQMLLATSTLTLVLWFFGGLLLCTPSSSRD